MNHKQTLVILGSGLMVLALATAAGFFLFAPASSSAQIAGINGASNSSSSYDDFVSTPSLNTQTGALDSKSPANNDLTTATLPSGSGYIGRSISASSLATQRQRMAFRTKPAPGAQNQQQEIPGRPTSAQDLQSIMDAQRLAQSTLSSPTPVPVPAEEFILKPPSPAGNVNTLQPTQAPSSSQSAASLAKTKTTPKNNKIPVSQSAQNRNSQKTSAKAAAKPAEKRNTPTGYWIQLASYSTLNRAKGAQDDLKRLGLNTSIEVSNLGAGKLVYRVKAGAWSNEKEAKSFLENFTMNNKGFSDAFVVNSAL